VVNWIDQGLLKGHKTPTGRRRVEAADLSAFLRAHEMAVPPELEQSTGGEVVVVVDDDPGYRQALVLTIERLLEPGRQLDAEIIVVTGGMPDDATEALRRMGVKVIVNKADGMPAVVDAMRQALRRREAA
jgi:methylmalonyl-CoA mutase cobalamin-binding subunit